MPKFLDILPSSKSSAIVLAAGIGVLNAGFSLVLYKKYNKLAIAFRRLEAENAALNASIKNLQKSLKNLETTATTTTACSSDSELYTDALAEQPSRSSDSEPQQQYAMTTSPSKPTDATNEKQIEFAKVDELYEAGKYTEIYEQLTKAGEKDADTLWRLARTCYQLASPLEPKNPKKKQLLDEGHSHATAAQQLKPDDFYVLKWLAALTGSRTDFLGTKEKIEQGNVFKALLDQCLGMQPDDYALLHMRGRFSYSIASLSWFERKAAATFFATPPEATYEDAIRDFTAVHKLKPAWVENLLYTAKSHLAKGDKKEAVEYLKIAVEIKEETEDGGEPDTLKEAKELLKKHGK